MALEDELRSIEAGKQYIYVSKCEECGAFVQHIQHQAYMGPFLSVEDGQIVACATHRVFFQCKCGHVFMLEETTKRKCTLIWPL